MTRESSGVDNKYVQEDAYEGKTEVDEVLEKVNERRKSYNIAFQIGVIILHEVIN